MKKLLLTLILLISINSYAQEKDIEYYDITSVSYKTGMNKSDIIWSDWYPASYNLRIDYFFKQQTITIIKEESEFYTIESYIDSLQYEDVLIQRFKAKNELNQLVTIEFMIPDDKKGFFIVITNKKNEIIMYKIE